MSGKDSTYQERSVSHKKDNTRCSEYQCDQFFKQREHQFNIIKFGLDERTNLDILWNNWNKIPQFLRSTPDRIIINKTKKESFMLECKGCSTTFGLKEDEWDSYQQWDWITTKENNLKFYIHNFCGTGEFKFVNISDITEIVNNGDYQFKVKPKYSQRVMEIPFNTIPSVKID